MRRSLVVVALAICGCAGHCPAGPPGAPGSARAYAVVMPNPNGSPALIAARTKNFTAVARIELGTYCLTPDPAAGIDRDAVAVLVGLEAQLSQLPISNSVMEAYAYAQNTDCPGGIEVVTVADPTPSAATAGSNAVAFVVVIP